MGKVINEKKFIDKYFCNIYYYIYSATSIVTDLGIKEIEDSSIYKDSFGEIIKSYNYKEDDNIYIYIYLFFR